MNVHTGFGRAKERGPMTLNDHLRKEVDAGNITSYHEWRSMASAMKRLMKPGARYAEALGTGEGAYIIPSQGERGPKAKWHGSVPAQPDTLPAPVFLTSPELAPVDAALAINSFNLPTTENRLKDARRALIKAPLSVQRKVAAGFEAASQETAWERQDKQHHKDRAADLQDRLATSRENEQFLQSLVLNLTAKGNATTGAPGTQVGRPRRGEEA